MDDDRDSPRRKISTRIEPAAFFLVVSYFVGSQVNFTHSRIVGGLLAVVAGSFAAAADSLWIRRRGVTHVPILVRGERLDIVEIDLSALQSELDRLKEQVDIAEAGSTNWQQRYTALHHRAAALQAQLEETQRGLKAANRFAAMSHHDLKEAETRAEIMQATLNASMARLESEVADLKGIVAAQREQLAKASRVNTSAPIVSPVSAGPQSSTISANYATPTNHGDSINAAPPRSPREVNTRRYWMWGLCMAAVMIVVTLTAVLTHPHKPIQQAEAPYSPPSSAAAPAPEGSVAKTTVLRPIKIDPLRTPVPECWTFSGTGDIPAGSFLYFVVFTSENKYYFFSATATTDDRWIAADVSVGDNDPAETGVDFTFLVVLVNEIQSEQIIANGSVSTTLAEDPIDKVIGNRSADNIPCSSDSSP